MDHVARGEEHRVAEASEPVDRDRPALVLEFVRQPRQRRVLADGDDHVVDGEPLRRGLAVDRNRRRVNRSGEARRVQLQRLGLAVPEHCRHRQPVHQLDALGDHVVEIFRHARHLARVGLHGDHRHLFGALAERFAGAVDGGVAAADDGDARAEPHR